MHPEYSGQRVLLVLGTQTKHETNTRFFLDRDAGSELMPELGEFKTLRIQVKQRVPTSKSVMAWVPKWHETVNGLQKRESSAGDLAAMDDGSHPRVQAMTSRVPSMLRIARRATPRSQGRARREPQIYSAPSRSTPA